MGIIERNIGNLHDQDTGLLVGYRNPVTGKQEDLNAPALQALVSGAGIGGSTITRAALVALAEADGLTPGALYLTTDGLLCQALTARFLQPLGPWFVDGRRWSVGAATTPVDLTHTYLPPLAPNAQVEVYSQWVFDPVAVTKRARLYLDGVLGTGTGGAQSIYERNVNGASDRGLNLYTRAQNQNDAAVQQCLTQGDGSAFGVVTNAFISTTVSTNTSKLLRAMGETSKTGSNVTITALTRTGSTATATTGSAHNLTTGDFIGVTGASQTEYNVDPVQITVTSTTQFTYPVSGTPTTPATGSPVYQKFCRNELVSFRVVIHQGLGF